MNHKERGAMSIIEATVVFPVAFIAIFFMLFAGNAFYQRCQMESIVQIELIEHVAKAANPMLSDVIAGKTPTTSEDVDVQPYRYLIGLSGLESDFKKSVQEKLSKVGTGYIEHMEPENLKVTTHYENDFVYSTFSAEVTYKIMIPIKLLGASDFIHAGVATRVELPVCDPVEFIRTADFLIDELERLGVQQKIEGFQDKLNGKLSSVQGMIDKIGKDKG